jgi:hypothetical protein
MPPWQSDFSEATIIYKLIRVNKKETFNSLFVDNQTIAAFVKRIIASFFLLHKTNALIISQLENNHNETDTTKKQNAGFLVRSALRTNEQFPLFITRISILLQRSFLPVYATSEFDR